jgi:hypothetical protein
VSFESMVPSLTYEGAFAFAQSAVGALLWVSSLLVLVLEFELDESLLPLPFWVLVSYLFCEIADGSYSLF